MGYNESIPEGIGRILAKIREAEYEAYPVGGCVRDLVLKKVPKDWDITTSATPNEVKLIFPREKIVDTGIAHGTVTLISKEHQVEITTYRCEEGYSDGRHPDKVKMTKSLKEDLKRRDFTMNALCLDENGNVIDMFGGLDDIRGKNIRAIGNPIERFSEDSLRILRALRFSAQYGFAIEEDTQAALIKLRTRLSTLSGERVMSELLKLICSEFAVETLLKYPTVVFEIIPELAAEKGLFQRQDYHCYDVYEHTVRAMGEIAPIEDLRLAMLLHDVGKPACSDGYGHFKGHAKVSAKLTEEILRRFNCSNNRVKNVVCLVGAHSIELKADKTYIKQLMSNYGTDMVKNILAVAKADNSAKRPTAREQKLEVIAGMENILADILKSTPSISLQMLAVSGDEIIASGVQKGPMVGKILNDLLQDVIEENVENTKQSLLEEVEKKLRKNF